MNQLKLFWEVIKIEDRNCKLFIGLLFTFEVIRHAVVVFTDHGFADHQLIVMCIGIPVLLIGYGIISALEEISDKLDTNEEDQS